MDSLVNAAVSLKQSLANSSVIISLSSSTWTDICDKTNTLTFELSFNEEIRLLYYCLFEIIVHLHLFQHNWVSRRADQGPKTIEQIHKEAKIEEQEEQRKVHQQLLSKDSKRRPGQTCSLNPL